MRIANAVRGPEWMKERPRPSAPREKERIKPENYEWIGGWCEGKEAWVFGGDASLVGFRFDRLREKQKEGVVIIAVNTGFLDMQFADLLVFNDAGIARKMEMTDQMLRERAKRIVCSIHAKFPAGGNVATLQPGNEIREWPTTMIYSGHCSTHLGISVALFGGASKVRVFGASGRAMDDNAFTQFIVHYVMANHAWYDISHELIDQVSRHISRHGILQHYYGFRRPESWQKTAKRFAQMNSGYAPFRKFGDRIVVHNYQSGLHLSALEGIIPP